MTTPISVTGTGITSARCASRTWMDELNAAGTGSLRIPAIYAAPAADTVVTCKINGSTAYAWIVEQVQTDLIGEGGATWHAVSGRGLLSWLDRGIVYPPGCTVTLGVVTIPDAVKQVTERRFDWASPEGPSHDLGVTWAAPLGCNWSDDTTGRAGYPKEWPAIDGLPGSTSAYWLWPDPGPLADVAEGATAWFRTTFTLTAAASLRVWITGDNAYELIIDGRPLASAGITDEGGYGWMNADYADVDLAAGDHVACVKGTNQAKVPSGGNNPAGIIVLARTIEPTVSEDPLDWTLSSLVSTTSWECCETEPTWTAGDVLDTLLAEATARGVSGISSLTWTFDATNDSDGNPWTVRVSRSWPVGASLLDVARDLAELGVDIWVDPATLELMAVEGRGTATGITLSGSTNTMALSVTDDHARSTVQLVRHADGLVEVAGGDPLGGRREAWLEAGQADSDTSATTAADAAFAAAGWSRRTVQVGAVTLSSSLEPGIDVLPGDTLTTPAGSARVLSLSVTEDDAGVVTWTPELEIG